MRAKDSRSTDRELVPPDGLNRLPKRFQQYVNELRSRLTAFEQSAMQTKPTRLYLDDVLHEHARQYLNETRGVQFQLERPQRILEVKFTRYNTDQPMNSIQVCATHLGRIKVIPIAGNVVEIAIDEGS